MRLLFWVSTALIAYTYVGYPAWLWLRSRWRILPIYSGPHSPPISIVLIVRNEALTLRSKIRNLLEISYPPEHVQILIVSDGSTDDTNLILSEFSNEHRVRIVTKHIFRGKAAGLNDALALASGEIVVFSDARQQVAQDAIKHLIENFADPTVGCASGELILGNLTAGEATQGMGMYWRIEKFIRQAESATGSVVGATGALYAARKHLVAPIPVETILDDVFIPMQIARQGARVTFEPKAIIWDVPDLGTHREFQRKVRTLTGIYQLLKLQPWLLSTANPLLFAFVSHKLLRLVVPFALCATLISSILLPATGYRLTLVFQLSFYGLSLLRWLLPTRNPMSRFADAAFTFLLLNTAAAVAFGNFLMGRKPVWTR